MHYPVFNKSGSSSCIGIFAPSAGVGHKLDSFDLSLESLRAEGFSIKECGRVRVDALRPDSGLNRAKAFIELLEDDEVDIIVSAAGGEFCFDILPYLDEQTIINYPKWVCGASDPTSILYYMTTKLDIATIYGFNAGTFDWRPLHRFQENALSVLKGDIPKQDSFEKYDNNRDFAQTDIVLNGNVYWTLGNCPKGRLDVSGRLIGGCSDVLSMLMGTPFDGTADFLERYSEDGIIWYLDPFEANPISLHNFLLRMKYSGWLENTKAVIIGRIMFSGEFEDEDFLELISEDLDCPFVFNADIGHVKPCMTMINGAMSHWTCSEGKAAVELNLI